MKKLIVSTVFVCICFFLGGCSESNVMNILYFTDNLNSIIGNEEISLSDYAVEGNCFRLILGNDAIPLLFTAETGEKDRIKKIRLTISKTDEKGNIISLDNAAVSCFFESAANVLEAFTFFNKDKCESLLKELLPVDSKTFSKNGELTAESENFRLVYYSNDICSQFFVTNTFLEKEETTKKPESKPLFAETANVNP